MNVTEVDLIRSTEPIELPEPWRAAWREPDGEPITSFEWSVVRVHTDEGIVGIGPGTGIASGVDIERFDPAHVERFWTQHLSRKRAGNAGKGAAGVEIALWDALGKAVGKPVHELLGAVRECVPVYAATSRLLEPDDLVETVLDIRDNGFQAVKLRMHRPDPEDDLAAVRTVREAVGETFTLMVDANQNNASESYEFWSRQTARRIARELDDLGVHFIEEPRPRRDVEGLAQLSERVDTAIAGGEHSATPYDFRDHLERGAYDILQPDVLLGGNMGISGVRRTAIVADFFDRTVIPHVCSNGTFPLGLAATLQAAATVESIPMVEYPYDPPILTRESTQTLVDDPLWIDGDGAIEIPDAPGIGVSLDQTELAANGEIVWTSS